jgi:hypothetical protein
MSRTRRTLALVAVASAALLAGCSSGASSSGSNSADVAAVAPPGGSGSGKALAGDSAKTPQASGANSSGSNSTALPAANGRQIVRTASISIKAEKVGDAVTSIRRAATDVGGYSSDENSGGDHGALTLKVPADKLESVLDKIGSFGTTTSRSEHAEDVTDQMVDVTSRLATQRASVDRVRALMDKATSLSDITQLESELTKREADLESLEQRHDSLTAQVAMSTVTVEVNRTDAPPPPPADQASFLSALGGGWQALLATLNGIGVGIGALLPFLLVVGIPAGGVYYYLRRRKARTVS